MLPDGAGVGVALDGDGDVEGTLGEYVRGNSPEGVSAGATTEGATTPGVVLMSAAVGAGLSPGAPHEAQPPAATGAPPAQEEHVSPHVGQPAAHEEQPPYETPHVEHAPQLLHAPQLPQLAHGGTQGFE